MQSWKQRKLHDEKIKARRKTKVYDISHAGKEQMSKILEGKSNINEDPRFLEKLRIAIRRSVFR
jgi:hypothetical protein